MNHLVVQVEAVEGHNFVVRYMVKMSVHLVEDKNNQDIAEVVVDLVVGRRNVVGIVGMFVEGSCNAVDIVNQVKRNLMIELAIAKIDEDVVAEIVAEDRVEVYEIVVEKSWVASEPLVLKEMFGF